MRLNKEEIYNYLLACQKQFGGYTGKDLEEISKHSGFDRRTVKRSVEEWSRTDSRFAELKYISQHSISITAEDIAILNQRLKENITIRKQYVIREINDNRIKRGEASIPQSTLYHLINNLTEALTIVSRKTYHS